MSVQTDLLGVRVEFHAKDTAAYLRGGASIDWTGVIRAVYYNEGLGLFFLLEDKDGQFHSVYARDCKTVKE